MNFKRLGNTDLKVSTICLGTMTWGEQNTEKEAYDQIDCALDYGVNFLDTAELYSIPAKKETFGKTEEIIGNYLKKKNNREKIIVATKISGPGIDWIRKGGLQYTSENIGKAVDQSLKRLKTDYIDLYQLHWPERGTNIFGERGYKHKKVKFNEFEKVLEDLYKFIEKGKIRHIGVSNETAWGTSEFIQISKKENLPRIVSVQNAYNLLNRTYEIGLAEVSIRENCGLLAYSPLAGGHLTGKYRNNNLPKNSRMELFGNYFSRYKKPNSNEAIEKYYEIAEQNGLNLTQMSIKFCEIQSFVSSVIIGATTIKQLKKNLESVNVELNKDVLKKIDEIQKIYPNPCP